MCGIVGYVGDKQAAPILLAGLSKLEYRGYDSAGLAVRDGEELAEVVKATGKLVNLSDKTDGGKALSGCCGIGHTRWATHGVPSKTNAHPHVSGNCTGSASGPVESEVVGVHNGIIENYQELKEKLLHHGYEFYSDTDTEILIMLAKENCPDIEIHLSTQANNTNYMTYRFWYGQGVKRVVSARELSLKEIKEIREQIPEDMEIESFIHGAMCISYSGRCLLSNYFTGRDANRGACTHPCRWKYAVVEESRPGEYMPVYENERGTYIFNSKDLCMIEHIPEMIDAGIDSFKIEGRMKTALYVATVARTYRKAIDACLESKEAYEAILPWCREEISKCTYRQFTTGFYFGRPDENTQIYDSNTYEQEYIYLGIVEDAEAAQENAGSIVSITQRNKFSVGETIEIMKPDGSNVQTIVLSIVNEEGQEQESAPHPQQKLRVLLSEKASHYDLLRKKACATS